MSAPICPRKECGHRLIETTGPWRDRGDWMCHGEHDGKRIWHSLELIQILESKLASAEAKISDLKADAASWQQQADDRLNDAVEFGRRAEKAEARVKELEGLAIGNESEGDGGRWFEVFIPTERIGGANCEGEECPTLGDAMPRKDS